MAFWKPKLFKDELGRKLLEIAIAAGQVLDQTIRQNSEFDLNANYIELRFLGFWTAYKAIELTIRGESKIDLCIEQLQIRQVLVMLEEMGGSASREEWDQGIKAINEKNAVYDKVFTGALISKNDFNPFRLGLGLGVLIYGDSEMRDAVLKNPETLEEIEGSPLLAPIIGVGWMQIFKTTKEMIKELKF